jgi:hypothetical protein
MPMKLVTSLASLKSRHLEESELGGRGNHAVGEFVCAEGSVSKVQEIHLVLPLHRAIARFVAIAGNSRNTTQARKHQKRWCIGETHNHCWIVVIVFTRNILSWRKG